MIPGDVPMDVEVAIVGIIAAVLAWAVPNVTPIVEAKPKTASKKK
jgi:hypothetical protein